MLEPTTPFLPNWHIDLVCEHLEAITAGETTRLLINLPPRYMKSLLVSVFWPVWEWISSPSRRWICVSYSDSLSLKLSLDRRTLVQSDWYQARWAAILAAGYAPAVGFLHTGKPLSFVYDVADIYKFETVVPIAFRVAGQAQRGKQPAAGDPVGEVRRGCRDSFRKTGVLHKLIPGIEEMLAAGGFEPSRSPEEAQPVAIPEEPSGDVGHRG